MHAEQKGRQRPRLTLKILFYAAFDVAGMILFASGAMWLLHGQALFFEGFPANGMQATIFLIAGIAIMVWAAGKILHETMRRNAQ